MFVKLLKATCNGIAQVTFIENWQYGLIVGIFITLINPSLGISIFLGSFLSNLIAWRIYDEEFVTSGIAAFNTVIFFLIIFFINGGLSNVFYVIPLTFIVMLVFFLLTRFFGKFKLSALALPGVLTSYLAFYLGDLIPSMFAQSQLTAFFEFSQFLGGGVLNHFLGGVSLIYLQENAWFTMVLLLCYTCVRREYLLYIFSSFVFAYVIYFLIQPFYFVDLSSFFIFDITLGLMGAATLGVIKKGKYQLLWIFLFIAGVIFSEIIFNYLFSFTPLKAHTLPFMTVIYLVQIYQQKLHKSNI